MPLDAYTLAGFAMSSDPVEEQSDESQVLGYMELVTLPLDPLAGNTQVARYAGEEVGCTDQDVEAEAGTRSSDVVEGDSLTEQKAQDRGSVVHTNRGRLQQSCIFFSLGD